MEGCMEIPDAAGTDNYNYRGESQMPNPSTDGCTYRTGVHLTLSVSKQYSLHLSVLKSVYTVLNAPVARPDHQ